MSQTAKPHFDDRIMLTHESITHLCGDLPDWKVARIAASRASHEDLIVAFAWFQGQQDSAEYRLLSGPAAYVYEVLTADEDIWGDDRGP
jgi:hypothetical protein